MLFAYGTLTRQSGAAQRLLLRGRATYVGNATLQAQLYRVRWYPGAVASSEPADQVLGELWRLRSPRALQLLDLYENATNTARRGGEYRRRIMPVRLPDGSVRNAWVYLYQRSVRKLPLLASGRFVARCPVWHGAVSRY